MDNAKRLGVSTLRSIATEDGRWQAKRDTAFPASRPRAKAPSPLSTLRSVATQDGRSALLFTRISMLPGGPVALSSFGGESSPNGFAL